MLEVLKVNYDLFRGFAFYTSIILLKLVFMVPFTGYYRMKNKAFANPEDAKRRHTVPNLNDPDVERVRRNHQNDLENIPLFIFLALLYVLTNPSVEVAMWHFRIFAASRIMHTISYSILHNPSLRAMSFGVGMLSCLSMLVQCITFYVRF